jgi:hypothetical protein
LIAAGCSKFRGHAVQVFSYGMDGEGSALGGQIISLLRSVGIAIADSRASHSGAGQFDVGVHVRGPDSEDNFVSALGNSLSSLGKLQVSINQPVPRAGAMMNGGGEGFIPGTVFVSVSLGIKPLPMLPAKP